MHSDGEVLDRVRSSQSSPGGGDKGVFRVLFFVHDTTLDAIRDIIPMNALLTDP